MAMLRTIFCIALLSACSPPKPKEPQVDSKYEQSMARVCEVDKMAGLDPENNLIGIDGERHEWLIENVEHPDVIELITLLRVESSATRARMLRDAAADCTSLNRCSLADFYEQLATYE